MSSFSSISSENQTPWTCIIALVVCVYVVYALLKFISKREGFATINGANGARAVKGNSLKSVKLLNDVFDVLRPAREYPDGVTTVISLNSDTFYLYLQEYANSVAISQSPYYENIPLSDWQYMNSLGSKSNPLPTTRWLTGVFQNPNGGFMGFVHLENHTIAQGAPATWKHLAVVYSTNLVDWSPPQIIISTSMLGQGSPEN